MKYYIKSSESAPEIVLKSLEHDKGILESLNRERLTETMLRNIGFSMHDPKKLIKPLLDQGLSVDEVIDQAINKIDKEIEVVKKKISRDTVSASSRLRPKYSVDCEHAPSFSTEYPEVAIKKWFEMEEKYPMDCAIYAYNKNDAIELVNFAASNQSWFKKLYDRYNCPYKWDWMINGVLQSAERGCPYFLGNGEFGDQIGPFSYG